MTYPTFSPSSHLYRIGLLGGTFDPPHRGHLALAYHFAKTLQLDQLIWIPTGHSWQKLKTSSNIHRFAMTQLIANEFNQMLRLSFKNISSIPKKICSASSLSTSAIYHCVDVLVSEMEVHRQGPSYTLDTLRELRTQYGENVSLCWLMGLDQLLQLTSWNTWQQLFDYSHLCVANRPGYLFHPQKDLNDFLYARLGPTTLVQSQPYGVLLFDSQLNVEISSTQLRQLLEQRTYDSSIDLSAWLIPSIVDYIEQHQLYCCN